MLRSLCEATRIAKRSFAEAHSLRGVWFHLLFLTNLICESGGTGRRARLRGVWFTPYGFKSRFSHQKNPIGFSLSGFSVVRNRSHLNPSPNGFAVCAKVLSPVLQFELYSVRQIFPSAFFCFEETVLTNLVKKA